MASYEQQAKDIIKDAQKKLNSWGFSFFYSLEDIAEMYEKAGNMFKLAQQCTYEKKKIDIVTENFCYRERCG